MCLSEIELAHTVVCNFHEIFNIRSSRTRKTAGSVELGALMTKPVLLEILTVRTCRAL